MKLISILFFGLISINAFADHFKQEAIIKINDKIAVQVSSLPSLQEKKVSTVRLKVLGSKKVKVLSFDAEMPDHDHGMITKATAPQWQKATKEFEVKGVKLHMPGHWLLKVKIEMNGKSSEHQVAYQLKH